MTMPLIPQINNGRLSNCSFIASPNFNKRPPNRPINTIVIHNISLPPAQFGWCDDKGNHYVSALFTNTLNPNDHPYFMDIHTLQVSAHLFIDRQGDVIQYVNFEDRAWHAGQSVYLGQSNVNDFSIGIELEGADDVPFTNAQYQALAPIVVAIYKSYPATYRHIAGHSDIARHRKTDPGRCFDWQLLRQMVDDIYHATQ